MVVGTVKTYRLLGDNTGVSGSLHGLLLSGSVDLRHDDGDEDDDMIFMGSLED